MCYPSYIGWLSQSQIISRNKNRQKLLVEREAFVYTYLIENTKKKEKVEGVYHTDRCTGTTAIEEMLAHQKEKKEKNYFDG